MTIRSHFQQTFRVYSVLMDLPSAFKCFTARKYLKVSFFLVVLGRGDLLRLNTSQHYRIVVWLFQVWSAATIVSFTPWLWDQNVVRQPKKKWCINAQHSQHNLQNLDQITICQYSSYLPGRNNILGDTTLRGTLPQLNHRHLVRRCTKFLSP